MELNIKIKINFYLIKLVDKSPAEYGDGKIKLKITKKIIIYNKFLKNIYLVFFKNVNPYLYTIDLKNEIFIISDN